jgi:type I restriction enzyme M protein
VQTYFAQQKAAIDEMEAKKESLMAELAELEEEHGATGSPQGSGEEGYFANFEKLNKPSVQKRLKELNTVAKVVALKKKDYIGMVAEEDNFYSTADDGDAGFKSNTEANEIAALEKYLTLTDAIAEMGQKIKTATEELDKLTLKKYPTLTEDDIKHLVVDLKWMAGIEIAIGGELDRISQRLTQRIKELGDRYDTPLPMLNEELKGLETKVAGHLAKMGFSLEQI